MLVYSPRYNIDLRKYGFDKPFALDRGQQVLDALAAELGKISYIEPTPISLEDAKLVHTPEYLCSLDRDETWFELFELKENELLQGTDYLPLHQLLGDILLKSGGTLLAARTALEQGLSCNLGGGYHHAFPEQGRGFCAINDIAIAIRKLQKENSVSKVIVVDLDFHQGDGTALIFKQDPSVFTLSVHSEEGWPDKKQESDLDVAITTTKQHLYLEKTASALEASLSQFEDAELCIYVAGSDPYELDVLPGTRFLKLNLETLKERDELIINAFSERKIPLAMVFAGGYGPDVWRVHFQAVRHLVLRQSTISDTMRVQE